MTPEDRSAREAIRYTLELYNRNADTADYDGHVDVFLPDATMSVQNGPDLVGLGEIQAAMRNGAVARKAYDHGNFQRHHLTSTMIELVDGQSAKVTTYVIVTTEIGLDHTGRYDDEFVAVGERWLLKQRHAKMEWSDPRSRFTAWLGSADAFDVKG